MVRVRKLVLAIAAASALNAGAAYALGVGELNLQSSLNQPLVAEIELLQLRDLEEVEIRPSLASAEEFNKAGVDRQYFLTDLTFTPVVRPNGKSVIRVTSSKPVREPYLNFLMEVVWPNGRLLREYTLLVDPPLYTPAPVVAAPSRLPSVATSSTPVRSVAPVAATRPVATSTTAAAPARPAATAGSLAGTEYRTSNNDTLWEIAQKVSSGSVHQTMLAIQDLNPDAFIGGNINRLKTGQVLRLPTEEQVRNRSVGDAVAQVSVQNTAWREGRAQAVGERQLDATKRESAGSAPAQAQATDSLRLVAGDAGKAATASEGSAAQVKALNDKLAVAQEGLDSSRRENTDLQGKVSSLESQLEKLERLLEMRNNQLAKLEEDLKKAGEAKAQAAVQPVEVPIPTPVLETPVVTEPQASNLQSVPEAAEPPPPVEVAVPDFNYSEEPELTEITAQVEQPAEQPAVAVQPESVESAAPVQTPAVPAPVAQASFIDELLNNQMLMAILGGGAVVLLLALLMFLSRRNAKREEEMQETLMQQEQGSFDAGLDLSEANFDGLDTLTQANDFASQETAADPLAEADACIAYGKFTQAAELLRGAINDEPQRTDLRLKLMEVYAELDDREGFAREENELREIGVASAQLDQLKSKYANLVSLAGGAAAVATASSLDDFSFDDFDLNSEATVAPVAAESTELDDSFDLGLDDLETELAASAEIGRDKLDDFADLGLGSFDAPEAPVENPAFDLDLSFEATEKAAQAEVESALDDFNFDLDETPVASVAETALPVLDDDFSLNLEAESVPELDAAVEAVTDFADLQMPNDFDLSVAEEAAPSAVDAESEAFFAGLDEVADDLNGFAAEFAEPAQEQTLIQPAVAADSFAAADDDFDFLSGTDETATKLDLARAYIDMGDSEGARDILDEVLAEGSESQQTEARELIAGLS